MMDGWASACAATYLAPLKIRSPPPVPQELHAGRNGPPAVTPLPATPVLSVRSSFRAAPSNSPIAVLQFVPSNGVKNDNNANTATTFDKSDGPLGYDNNPRSRLGRQRALDAVDGDSFVFARL